MSNLPQSDLILAGRFVDGDLPTHEAAQAEARIATDADFAAVVEQIRDQSSLLGRLPKFKPSDDLADRTLQASMDQVKAIMGAWPIASEGDGEKVSVASEAAAKSFDWKSTAALVASLAGVFMLGAILWQNNFSSESNMAMSEAPPMTVASRTSEADAMPEKSSSMEDVEMEKGSEPSFAAAGMQPRSKSAAKGDRSFPVEERVLSKAAPHKIAAPNAMPGRDIALSGTPMKQPPAPADDPQQTQNTALVNASAPVSQIWCVNQDSTASKSSVSDILNLNQIAVQREQTPQQTADAVEAFYVAATPKQMKLALSQISNNADIEMIELPSIANSQIADAIQQQFTQSDSDPKVSADAPLAENLPPNFQRSQALAQHLVSNPLPRSLPGPVPPILKSGDKIAGLENAPNGPDLAMASRARLPAPASASNVGGGGAGFSGGGIDLKKVGKADEEADDAAVAMAEVAKLEKQTAQLSAQQAELDKYLDDSEQLRQYLILVRGGEEAKR